jgi:hypothetical protein
VSNNTLTEFFTASETKKSTQVSEGEESGSVITPKKDAAAVGSLGLASPAALDSEPATPAKDEAATAAGAAESPKPSAPRMLQGEPKKLQDIFNFTKPVDKTHSVRQVNAFDKLL